MPTCMCEPQSLDQENHVCPLNSIVENNEFEGKQDYAVRYRDGSVRLRNPNIELMDQDILYHLALGSGSHDLVEMFGDVKFVCMGGTPKRMEDFAHFIMKEIGHKLPSGTTLLDISQYSYRYCMYKVGPVLSISSVLGKMVRRPAKLDRQLARELKALAHREDPYETVVGKTMCTYDFYEGQGRLDGAFCDFTENDKMDYLSKLHKAGVVNIEMESLSFAALTHHAGIKSAVVCVTLLDRLKGDQVMAPKEVLDEWQIRPQQLVARYITRYLQRKGRLSLEGHGSMCVKSPRRFKLVQQESENYD
ncbi:uridine phosphorylase 2 isoform X4 [Megalopta genalis]|uniref:uridine phosphorylase 2 isoform X4 n=1 Tax=Megalopta genalis TaxID=115081 RepID=UPI003FD67CB7